MHLSLAVTEINMSHWPLQLLYIDNNNVNKLSFYLLNYFIISAN